MSISRQESERLEALASELHSVALHLLRRVRQEDDKLRITPARLSALSVVVFGGPMSLNALAGAEQVTGPTMSRIVAALEDKGLIRRDPHPQDRRAVRLRATRAGRQLMERGRRRRVRRLVTELEGLTPSDQQALYRAVDILRSLELKTQEADRSTSR